MENDSVIDLLDAADWKDIIRRLTYYAVGRASRYRWTSGSPQILPGGMTPEDLALSAVKKVYDGTRNWDPEKYPYLLKHLMWIVDSDIDHLYCSAEHRKTTRMSKTEDRGVIEITASQAFEAGKISTPEEELIAREERDFEDRLKSELYAIVEGDDDLESLLLCFEEGIDKPMDIAAQLKWDVSKVYNLKRKLYRKAIEIKKMFS